MKRAVINLARLYLLFIAVFIAGKIFFMLRYYELYSSVPTTGLFAPLLHGLRLDRSVSGYLTVIPALISAVSMLLSDGRPMRIVMRIYLAIIAAVISAVFIADTALYGYWGFKLDMTPVFYFMSSPKAAAASAPLWLVVTGIVTFLLLTWVIYRLSCAAMRLKEPLLPQSTSMKKRLSRFGLMLLFTALLFIPIRGSFSVAPVNLSSAYFSDNQRLNHAAVNPAFSLLYSATHQSNFARQFRFMDNDKAAIFLSEITSTASTIDTDTLLTVNRPDIYIIILESFSAHLLPSLGGENVAPGLDSIASAGLLFDNFYACSFRTDRALPAILAGYPSQPTTSLMKYVEKTDNLPSIPRSLKEAGYETSYYYGGDADFTNMKAFLVSAGFDRIISDRDFPRELRTGKWGVHDGPLFDRVIDEHQPYDSGHPRLRVIQTSSSHEPFEVPFQGRFTDSAANAFEYTDSCLTAFVNRLAASHAWDNSLLIIIPDHYGCYPRDFAPLDVIDRHHIPLILTGGALALTGTVSTPGSQNDIAATLLGMLHLDHTDFTFSRDLLNPEAPHTAYVSSPSYAALIDRPDVTTVYDIDRGITVTDSAARDMQLKAFLQSLYDDIDRR